MQFLKKSLPEPIAEAIDDCSGYFRSSAVFSAFVNILFLAPTIYMMQVYDRVVPTGGVVTLLWLTVILGIALAVLSSLDSARSRLMVRAALRLNDALSAKLFNRILEQEKTAQGKTGQGSAAKAGTAQAMRELDVIRQAMVGPGLSALFDLPWTLLYLLVALLLHPALALLIVVGSAVLVILAQRNERSVREGLKRSHQAVADAHNAQDQIAGQAELIRALGMREALVNRQIGTRNAGLGQAATAQLQAANSNAIVKFVRLLLQSLALGLAAWLAVGGQISAGAIIAGSVLLSRALQPIEQLAGAWPQLTQAKQSMDYLNGIFERGSGAAAKTMILPTPAGHLALAGVALRNPQQTAFIIRGIQFEAQPGEIVGVLGPSGSGKTTLARIAAGGIRPDVGELRIDGAEFESWDPELLARHIGYLPQDCGLIPGTVLENISRFATDLGESANLVAERAVKAARLAGIHDMILRLPDGYDTRIGDAGVRLSGGQAQRLALARALYGDPSVLVLDEPNSALDNEGELALIRALEAGRIQKQGILLISHKPQMLQLADRLIVMVDGMITMQGPRDQIIQTLTEAAERSNVVELKQAAGDE